MKPNDIKHASEALYSAWKSCEAIRPFSDRYEGMSIEDAYRVQIAFVEKRIVEGEKVIGKKIGVTSKAVMELLGVYQPDFGVLLNGMCVPSGQCVDTSSLIQPKAEGEIAFVLKEDLIGPGVTNADVLAATRGVMPCFEIVDSRIKDWNITIVDTVADNASCGLFVLGDTLVAPGDVDMSLCGMALEKNGEVVATGAGAAVLGSPVNAIAWLANQLGEYGIPLKAGEIILSGSLATMVPVKSGDYLRVSIGGVGSCSVRFG